MSSFSLCCVCQKQIDPDKAYCPAHEPPDLAERREKARTGTTRPAGSRGNYRCVACGEYVKGGDKHECSERRATGPRDIVVEHGKTYSDKLRDGEIIAGFGEDDDDC